jgi:Ser/Thr protein kinase RdoA (MazF antagonist)
MSAGPAARSDLPAAEVRKFAEQAVGRVVAWRDASWARESSRVWQARGAGVGTWYVKIHQNDRFHRREVEAYRTWVPHLGAAAPTLVAADSTLRAVIVTAVPGRPLHDLAHPAEEQQHLFHQIGALAAAIHRSSPAPVATAEGVAAFAKVERHLQAARPHLRPGDEEFIRTIAARAQEVSPLDCVPTHGDFQLHNLLLDQDGSLAVIDFERSEPGPAIRDLVRLCGRLGRTPAPLRRVRGRLRPRAHHSRRRTLRHRLRARRPLRNPIRRHARRYGNTGARAPHPGAPASPRPPPVNRSPNDDHRPTESIARRRSCPTTPSQHSRPPLARR